ncbi:MAG: SGNH/GDSL hydrolase family protein [Clostridia bacterium]|nr:SGNH/GDSL hydrolase family protein [Clostridia bacterium]
MENIKLTKKRLERSVAHKGNPYRILKVLEKAARGEEITYVAIGGSITQRYNASKLELCYASLIAKWLEEKFPNTKINYVNAGIGATGSLIGVHRLERDVLKYNPDFVTVEFSVNEGNGDSARESYDNLVYNIMNYKTAPAVLCIGMVNKGGGSAQDTHTEVARHYDIPYISYRDAVWCDVESGELSWCDLSNDNIHPHDAGHRLVADLVVDYIEKIDNAKEYSDNICDKPLVNNVFRDAKIYYVDDITPADFGCFAREAVNLNKIPFGWVAHENGGPLKFEFENCRRIYILFEKTNKGDGGKAIASVRDKETVLDADFKDGWGVYYNNTLLYAADTPSKFTLTITPQLEAGKHFAVAGIMVS